MSYKEEDYEEDDTSDDEFSPLVDGLSSAVVVVALISFVFLITTLNTSINLFSSYITFKPAVVKQNNQVNFFLGVALSSEVARALRSEIESQPGNTVVFDFVINTELSNADRLAQLAFINIYDRLKLTDKKMRIGTITIGSCDNEQQSSCFKWSVKNEK